MLKSRFFFQKIYLLLGFLYCSTPLFAVEFSLSYVNQTIFHPQSPIEIKARIFNDSSQDVIFRSAENRFLNLTVSAYTLNNLPLKKSPMHRETANTSTPHFYRNITLSPGEEYAFIFSLQDFIAITEPGVFIFEASYSTDFSETNRIHSNKVYLNIHPPLPTKDGLIQKKTKQQYLEEQVQLNHTVSQIAEGKSFNPDIVILKLLTALKRQQWEHFFLFVNLEELIRQSNYYYRRYIASREEEQKKLLKSFRHSIEKNEITETKALTDVPHNFHILRTTYTKKEAEVVVLQEFDYDHYLEKIRYTYYLRKENKVWKVYRYSTHLIHQ